MHSSHAHVRTRKVGQRVRTCAPETREPCWLPASSTAATANSVLRLNGDTAARVWNYPPNCVPGTPRMRLYHRPLRTGARTVALARHEADHRAWARVP